MAYIPFAPELGATYTLVDNILAPNVSIVLNDSTNANYVGVLSDFSGLDGAPILESAYQLSEMDGGGHGAFYLDRRPITFTLEMNSFSTPLVRTQRLDKIRRIMQSAIRTDCFLQIDNRNAPTPSLYTLMRAQQPMRMTGNWNKQVQLAFVAADPYLYATTTKTTSTTSMPGTLTGVENQGNAPSYPTIRVIGATSSSNWAVYVTNFQPGYSPAYNVTMTTNVAAGETLSIDCRTHRASFTAGARSGQDATRYIDFANTIWPVILGNGGTANVTLGGTSSGSFNLVFRDVWS